MAKRKNVPNSPTVVGGPKSIEDLKKEANAALDNARDKFIVTVTVGILENGSVDIIPSIREYPGIGWVLDRAKLELFLKERTDLLKAIQATAEGTKGS